LNALLLLAQAGEPVNDSVLGWLARSLGPVYGLLIPLTGIAVFVGGLLVVAFSRRPAVIAAYLVFVPLPLLIALFGTIHGAIHSYLVIAMSVTQPKPAEIAQGTSTALAASLVGIMATFPAYLVVSIGLFLRTVGSTSEE